MLKSLLGAWALAACSLEETAAVEAHLSDCGTCADEALRLRDAVGLLHPEDSLDLDPTLRSQVLNGCMVRRAPRIPVPEWAAPYDAESSRLDALLRDMQGAEWLAPVLLRWFDGRRQAERETTVGGVIAHLLAVDGLVASSLGLPDPLDSRAARAVAELPEAEHPPAEGTLAPAEGTLPGPEPAGATAEDPASTAGTDAAARGLASRTEECWRSDGDVLRTSSAREPWREQGRAMVRTVSFAGSGVAGLGVDYGDFTLPVRDALLDRAFECWMHAEDIAEAIDYPYTAPQGEHMHHMVDLAARLLPGTIAWRRRTGLAGAPRRLTTAGAPGRALHLEVEGDGGGDWYIPLDSPAAAVRPEDAVAHVALDRYEFCQLVAGHVPPLDTAAGQDGDREAVRDVLFAAASLSRM
nr:zf-HC2 domain-containing protein [Streptomyces sp. HNM0575]